MIRPLARVFDCTTFWGASSAAAGFAAKRHLFGIYGPYEMCIRDRGMAR